MLRMYFRQQWFGLADEAVEDAIDDSQSMRDFVGIDLARESVPDATTLLKFRRLLEARALTDKDHARPANAPDQEGQRVALWHEAHIGADADSGLVHSLHTTAANESDVAQAHKVLRGQEKAAFFDAGDTGVAKRQEITQAQENGKIAKDFQWNVALRRSKITKMAEGTVKTLTQALERVKAQVRAKVEHPFHGVENLFRYKKVRCKGLAKNTAQLYSLFGLAKLALAKNCLMAPPAKG